MRSFSLVFINSFCVSVHAVSISSNFFITLQDASSLSIGASLANIRSSFIRFALKYLFECPADSPARFPNRAKYLSASKFSVGRFTLISSVSVWILVLLSLFSVSSSQYSLPHCILRPSALCLAIAVTK
ncbi:unnamed protein product [Clavelina lepadiformis]|uniref:Secreted protein n=1 Tax=Clavelina lepadiformis TaxID=159417 RepID=A0ABP0FEN7_CLALP